MAAGQCFGTESTLYAHAHHNKVLVSVDHYSLWTTMESMAVILNRMNFRVER